MPNPSQLRRQERPDAQPNVITITADRKLTPRDNKAKVIFNSATSLNLTLPPPRKGLEFTFYVKLAAGSGNGHNVKTFGSAEKVFGKVTATGAAITEAAGKGVTNTQATGSKGDGGRVFCDGTDWFFFPDAGTFAREA